MVRYTFLLATEKTPDPNYVSHHLDLPPALENDPDRLFDRAFCEDLRSILQQKTDCAINDVQLDRIVKAWLEDIKEGYRNTRLVLELPPLEFENVHQLQDEGDRTVPPLIPPDLSDIAPQGGALPPLTFN
ncbi:hypothetical protein [Baaleninema sp.]|uniref:hypothetical protein n=1 Tax=Baaleninema sp. TaxID=3101197 RepID=UPI003D08219E